MITKAERSGPAAFRAVLGAGVALLLSACAQEPAAPQTAASMVKDPVETQTGSNIPRRNKPANSNVQVVDPEAMQGAARGATRNPGSGP